MNIVLFDGLCNFCNTTVLKIIKYDKRNQLKFSSLQSEFGKKMLKLHNMEEDDLSTIVFIKNDQDVYKETTAVIEIIKLLEGKPKILLIFRIMPQKIRDYFYRVFSRNRYKLFGKKDSCIMPPLEIRNKFIN
ncbi:thiol-disulfide oxidoreductase DCC family protein [Flavobacterium sp.]|jgi:predicted DCC family thiol-disulfide oxidoreductase YuxK|uniref:thiol-disulfide oxidoreductase DCC family protein n=1 Tax=Flavobacterium sp. TaxID=239 RepID=UPI0037845343